MFLFVFFIAWIIFFIIIAGTLALVLVLVFQYNPNNNNDNEEQNSKTNVDSNYMKKIALLTENEKKFYNVLYEIINKEEILIQTQVVLYDIIGTKLKNDYSSFNKIKSKSIDYVLVNKNFEILLCIELDDYTHNKSERIERDNFINKIFEETDIKLLRVAVEQNYDTESLRNIINSYLYD